MNTMTNDDWTRSEFFAPAEFHCEGVNVADKMDRNFILLFLNPLRRVCGFPLHITSSYRTPDHNQEVGGAGMSAHMDVPCKAADIMPKDSHERYVIVSAAYKLGCKRIGIYKDGSLHFDISSDRPEPVLWTVV